MWTSQQAASAAAARAAARAAQCHSRLTDLRERRPVGPDDLARAQASLLAAQSSASAAHGRLLLTQARSRTFNPDVPDDRRRFVSGPLPAAELDALRARVRTIGVPDVFLAAFGVGSTTTLFDFEAFAHGLVDLPDHELRVIEHAVWELEHF